jgi:hypothetical protein
MIVADMGSRVDVLVARVERIFVTATVNTANATTTPARATLTKAPTAPRCARLQRALKAYVPCST